MKKTTIKEYFEILVRYKGYSPNSRFLSERFDVDELPKAKKFLKEARKQDKSADFCLEHVKVVEQREILEDFKYGKVFPVTKLKKVKKS